MYQMSLMGIATMKETDQGGERLGHEEGDKNTKSGSEGGSPPTRKQESD